MIKKLKHLFIKLLKKYEFHKDERYFYLRTRETSYCLVHARKTYYYLGFCTLKVLTVVDAFGYLLKEKIKII